MRYCNWGTKGGDKRGDKRGGQKGTGYLFLPSSFFFGLPTGLMVDSNPYALHTFCCQIISPKGDCLFTLCHNLSSSFSVNGSFTYLSHSTGISIGGSSTNFLFLFPILSPCDDHSHSLAEETSPALTGLPSTYLKTVKRCLSSRITKLLKRPCPTCPVVPYEKLSAYHYHD